MIEVDYNAPEDKIYVQLDSGEFDRELDSMFSKLAYWDKAYTGFDGWVGSAEQMYPILRVIWKWLANRSLEQSLVRFIEM